MDPAVLVEVPNLSIPSYKLPAYSHVFGSTPPLWDGCSNRQLDLYATFYRHSASAPYNLRVDLHVDKEISDRKEIATPSQITDLDELIYTIATMFKPTKYIHDVDAVISTTPASKHYSIS
jgi:hypothetical protein